MGAHRLFYRTEFFRCGACKGLISDGDELFFHFAVGQHFSHGTVPILDFAGSCACWRVQAVGGTKGQGGQVSPYSYSVKAFRPSYTITRILGMAPPLAMLFHQSGTLSSFNPDQGSAACLGKRTDQRHGQDRGVNSCAAMRTCRVTRCGGTRQQH